MNRLIQRSMPAWFRSMQDMFQPRRYFASGTNDSNDDEEADLPDECSCKNLDPNVNNTVEPLKMAKVAILGGDSEQAKIAALQIKNSPYVSEIRVHGHKDSLIPDIADLADLSSTVPITAHVGANQLQHALSKAEIVLVTGGIDGKGDQEHFESNSVLVHEAAAACISHCPEALFAVSVEPINYTLPFFAEVLKQNGVLSASRTMGNAMGHLLAAKTLLAETLGLDPKSVYLPLTGGLSSTTLVPIISRVSPGGVFLKSSAQTLAEKVRSTQTLLKKKNRGVAPYLSMGYADAMFVDAIARGLCGEGWSVPVPVFIRSILVPDLDYLTLPVELGLNGVASCSGLPHMSAMEFTLLEDAVPILVQEIRTAQDHATSQELNLSSKSPRMPQYGSC